MSNSDYKKKKLVAQTVPFIVTIGAVETINSQSITVLEKDSSRNILRASGTVTITDAWSGYAKGCIYIETDVATWSSATFENVWSTTSCQFVQTSWVAQVTIPTAEVLTLFATPVELVAAPWTGKYILVDRITGSVDYVAAAYATNTTLEFSYGTATTACTADIAALLDKTADAVQTVWGIEAELAAAINDNIEVNVATGNPTAWDSDVKIAVQYRILSI